MANVRKVPLTSGKFTWRATIKTLEGKRKSKNHATKRKADDWVKKHDGAGATGSASMTVLELAKSHNAWFDGIVKAGERGLRTAEGYDSHMRNHLQTDAVAQDAAFEPLHSTILSDFDTARAQAYFDRLIIRTGSVETARRVRKSLSAWCAHGIRNGWMTVDPVKHTKIVEKRKRRSDSRVVLPPKQQLADLLAAAQEGPAPERDNAVVHLLMFGGLRISELLGLADDAVELRRSGRAGKAGGVLHVVERLCSKHNTLDVVKSDEGFRDVPIGPRAAVAVRSWRVARGLAQMIVLTGTRVKGRFLARPDTERREFYSYNDFRRLIWEPLMLRAGLAEVVKTGAHKRVHVEFSAHTLRHVFASIQIANGITPKRLQKLLGHSTLAMTMDLYGHLWIDPEADEAMAEAGERLIQRSR